MKKRVIIIGAGEAGRMVSNDLLHNSKICGFYEIVGFLDDDPNKESVDGIDVIGSIDDVDKIVTIRMIDEVIIAIPSASKNLINSIINKIPTQSVKVKIIPGFYDIIQGQANWKDLRTIRLEDLLGREEVGMDLDIISGHYQDKVVLVTGAGGSIGSEIVKHLLRLPIKQLVAFGHGENSIHNLIQLYGSDKRFTYCIGDIRDAGKLQYEFEKYKPDIVFHAAAHKHLPLMECYPDEAVKNNIIGTYNVVNAAIYAKVRKFLLISTDKAVRPTSVMGATKRIAELIVGSYNRTQSVTETTIVRFGNVLGSRGSVIPTFEQAIKNGGPINLTHPDIERYFMSIPEAARLVIKAICIPKSPTQQNIFVLDMGKPVKIIDLAKNMIKLSGYTENEISIRIVGLRKGEKLYEELSYDKTKLEQSQFEKIMFAGEEITSMTQALLDDMIQQFEQAAVNYDYDKIYALLNQYIPEYERSEE